MKKYSNIIGVSIEYDAISMFQIQGSDAVSLVRRIPEGLIKSGHIQDPERISHIINNMAENGGFRGKDCAIALPEYSTYFRMMDLPPMTEAELKLNLPYEFRDFVGDDGNDYFYDYAMDRILSEDGAVNGMHVFGGAVRKEGLQNIKELLTDSGLKLKLALPKEMSIINILRSAIKDGSDPGKEFCIVNIGYRHINVSILKNGKIDGSKVIYMGAENLDHAIETYLDIPRREAIELRVENRNGILSERCCTEIFDAISVEVMKAINFYEFENPDSQIDDVYFYGTDSDIPGIREAILNRMKVSEHDIEELLPSYCSSIGNAAACVMAIGVTMQESSAHITGEELSSPVKLPRRETMNLLSGSAAGGRDIKKIKLIAGILIALFLVFGVAGRYIHVYNLKQDLEDTKTELADTELQLTDYDSIKEEYDRYARTYMSSDEVALESRQGFINIAESAVDGYGTIESIAIVGNEAVINVNVSDLDNVAKITKILKAHNSVKNVNVYTASEDGTDTANDSGVDASLVFQMGEQIKDGDQ